MKSPNTAKISMEANKDVEKKETMADDKLGGNEEKNGGEHECISKTTQPEDHDNTIIDIEEKTYRTTSENSKNVRFSITKIDITEEKCIGDEKKEAMTLNPTNPRITISEPVGSPCDSEKTSVTRGRCPMYYGIKSYIHDFYLSPDKEVFKSGEFTKEDDFQWVVEPGKRRWKGCWFRTGLWVGVNLMLLGVIAMLVGHLTTPRQTVVMQQDNFTILDHWAVTFNNRLVVCQLAGLAGFTCGAVIVMLALLVSSYQQEQTRGYYVMAATVVPETFVGNPLAGPRQGWSSHRIPLSSSVSGIQPTFDCTH